MIENARRQVLLVAAVAIASLLLILLKEANLGLDLSGGTQLIYNLDIQAARNQGQVGKDATDEQIMSETLAIINDRIDPNGVLGAGIQRRGEHDFMIELPKVDNTKAAIIKGQIQNLGHLEIRMVADAEYDNDGVTFDLPGEKTRLEDWLNKDDHRARVAKTPETILEFNHLSSDRAGPTSKYLHWYPAPVFPDPQFPEAWDGGAAIRAPGSFMVPAYDQATYNAGPPSGWSRNQKPFLVDLYPINMHAEDFSGDDMDAGGVYKTNDPQSGGPAVAYKLKESKAAAYADFSDLYIHKPCAIILNGEVRSAPTFQARIFLNGIITGRFTDQEAADLARVIKTGSLKVKPALISDTSIGSTLGARSIELGIISIIAGGVLVLAFILVYYRLAGVVAFGAILLNIFLILGVLRFIEATLTLPGIAGLVLTMGMAIDANILIYERIREEIGRGKDLLQAVRAGFDRAMVTILDANITTFLAGVVLYNVGVGPVRGFAVTLMVGILTSLFTAFFASRLAFHYLLESKILTQFSSVGFLTGRNWNFLKAGRLAFAGSTVVVIACLACFFTTSGDTKYGLDFTGGASMEVNLKAATNATEIRSLLAADEVFRNEFPDPTVNTVDAGPDGTATQFSLKLKLHEKLSEQIKRDRKAAQEKGEEYEPPYKAQLRTILRDRLVHDAFTDLKVVPAPGGVTASGIATVHLAKPVVVAEVHKALTTRFGDEAEATALGEASGATAQDLSISFPVARKTTPEKVAADIVETFDKITAAKGEGAERIQLSEPIPNASDIGPRMVGELQNAAIGAMVLSLFLIVMYIRVRFHEYKYSFAAVAALIHDVLIVLGVVVLFNSLGLVNAEIDLAMIAAFLTVIGYSINDTIVIFDRIRENLTEHERLGDSDETFATLLNRSINQTLSRTILTSGTTLFVVLAQFVVNRGAGSALEGFSFALIVGIFCGTYSTIFIASPLVLWLRNREGGASTNTAQDKLAKLEGQSVAVQSV